MTPGITIAMITSRDEPKFDWFFSSLIPQLKENEKIEIILVDRMAKDRRIERLEPRLDIRHVEPKPSVWQGPTRLSKNERWAASNYRNTALALCRTNWIFWVDDRCVLMPNWMRGTRTAVRSGYAVFGSYEKGHDVVVESGVVKSYKETDGKDCRWAQVPSDQPYACPGEWSFGCCLGCPTEWALKIGGYDEFLSDGLGSEDVYFGMMLKNNGYPTCYDRSIKVFQDRTPSQAGPVMLRTDKGVSPDDKSHQQLYALGRAKHTMNLFDIRELRENALAGKPWPIPTEPRFDWYDGQPISEM